MQTFQVKVGLPYRRELAFTPDGRYIAVGAEVFTVLDTAGGPTRLFPEVDYPYRGFALLRHGTGCAVALVGDPITVFDLNEGPKQTIGQIKCDAREMVADPRGEAVFVSVSRGGKTTIRSFGADLTERLAFECGEGQVVQLAISADARWLAGRLFGRMWVRRIDSANPDAAIAPIAFDSPEDLSLSNDGELLAAVNGRGLMVWRSASVEEVFRSGKHRRGVTAVAWHPTRPVLVTGDNAGQVFVWDHTGRVLTRFDWGLTCVNRLVFAPDGLRCAAFGSTGKVVVWDVDV